MSQNKRRIRQKQTKRTNEERYQLVAKVDRYLSYYPHTSLNALCVSCGFSTSNYRRWKAALDEHPEYHEQGIIPTESTRPKHLARQTSEATRQCVIEEASKPHHTSAHSITDQLKSEGIAIGNGTVIEILEAAGLYGTIKRTNAKGECIKKKGLFRLCEKRQQEETRAEDANSIANTSATQKGSQDDTEASP
ncbi:hypothetical protein ELY33_17710 [Vreelandella andesensis]|uniref:Uncharacterized protein n=1 Tax=Vreelandella andesensis TaxID=447567 RepID=A0A3S1DG38_9GAMM|nr:hypothetical protein [Halomonas andesensis]RUR25704.1 hypothetical protein ELY33_17710 [Halomonas andesensis]